MSNYNVMAYTHGRESNKQSGIPKKFIPLWGGDICQGEDGGIYVVNGAKFHCFAKSGNAYKIVDSGGSLLPTVAELQNE